MSDSLFKNYYKLTKRTPTVGPYVHAADKLSNYYRSILRTGAGKRSINERTMIPSLSPRVQNSARVRYFFRATRQPTPQ